MNVTNTPTYTYASGERLMATDFDEDIDLADLALDAKQVRLLHGITRLIDQRFDRLTRLVSRRGLRIERLISATATDKVALEAALASLEAADTTIDAIEKGT